MADGLVDQRGLGPFEQGDHFPQRPDGAAHQQDLVAQLLDALQRLAPRVCHDLILEAVDLLPHFLHHDKIVIHHGIHEAVDQVVRPHLADPPEAVSYPLAERLEDPAFGLLEGQDEIVVEHEAQLLDTELHRLLVEGDQLDDQADVFSQVVDLRTLGRVHDVFHQQRMDLELAADLLDDMGLVDPDDIDPRHRRLAAVGGQFVDRLDLPFLEVIFRIIDHGDPGLFRPLRPDVDEASGREARLSGSFDVTLAHRLSPGQKISSPSAALRSSTSGCRASIPPEKQGDDGHR